MQNSVRNPVFSLQFLGIMLCLIAPCLVFSQTQKSKFAKKTGWKDEFNKAGKPDEKKWSYDLGCNWYNDEVQCYTDRATNVRVEKGHLTIEARNEKMEHREFTSARLISSGGWGGQKGIDKAAFPAQMEIDYVRFYPYIGK